MDKDILFIDYHDDIINQNLERFNKLGISKDKLKKWKNKYPFIYAEDVAYDKYRVNVNKKFICYPLIICMAEKDKDLIKCLKIVRKYKIHFAVRSGGHCVEPFSLSDGIIIDQSKRKEVKIKEGKITIQSGVLQGPLIYELQKQNLGTVMGTCCNVSLTGFTLIGGNGYLARKFGNGSDQILQAKVLLANGKIVKADENNNSDLFWALRGAGNGNFGIITELTLKTYKLKKVVLFKFSFNFDNLIKIAEYWQEWSLNLDENWGTQFRFKNGGNLPEVEGIYVGKKKEAKKMLSQFYSFDPRGIMFDKVDYAEVTRIFSGKGRWPVFTKVKNAFVKKQWPTEAFKIVRKYMAKGGGLSVFELALLGGNFNKPKKTDTAFVHRDSIFWFMLNGHWETQEQTTNEMKWINDFYKELLPYLSDEVYQNLPDADIKDYIHAYYGKNANRLVEIKNKYDPTNMFRYGQSIPLSL